MNMKNKINRYGRFQRNASTLKDIIQQIKIYQSFSEFPFVVPRGIEPLSKV